MSSPRFSPKQAVESRLRTRGLDFSDLRVGKKVILTWTEAWSSTIADLLGATPAPHTGFLENYWLRTLDNANGGATVAFAPVGAPGTIMMMEDLIAAGAESVLGIGASGGLDPDHPVGHVHIPSRVTVIDEGTSSHYPGNAEPTANPDLLAELSKLAQKHGATTESGDWWTTDAFYRELTDDIARHAENGVVGIDMETSAMYRVAEYRGVAACNMLVVSDELWTDWNYGIDFSEFQTGVSAIQNAAVEWALSD